MAGEHIQVFVYRVPRKSHAAFASAQSKLAEVFRKHGMVRSDFYVVGEGRIFGGFKGVSTMLGANADEEVWIEVETYPDAADSLRVIADIGKDPDAGPLFGQVIQLAIPVSVMADCDRAKL